MIKMELRYNMSFCRAIVCNGVPIQHRCEDNEINWKQLKSKVSIRCVKGEVYIILFSSMSDRMHPVQQLFWANTLEMTLANRGLDTWSNF